MTQTESRSHRGRLLLVLCLTAATLVAQVVGGVLAGSLALLADAGHLATDVAGVLLALLAAWFAGRPPTQGRTFGYYRLEILAAAGNAVLLFGVAVVIVIEAVRRLADPPPVGGSLMLGVAALGMVVNAIALGLLHGQHRHNLNVRGAYLEVLGDLLGSVLVLVAAGVIAFTGALIADPIASIAVGVLILPRTWSLLREAVDVLLEATPKGIDLGEVRQHLLEPRGVLDVHDLHAWTITSGLPVLSAHVVVNDEVLTGGNAGELLDQLHTCLAGHFDVEHSTFQLEPAGHSDHEGADHD
jgi:cobalt-zinc-cadmium efflux system protein